MFEDKIVPADELNVIVYNAINAFYQAAVDPVTPITPFESLEPELKALFELQMGLIVKNIKLKPKELHDNWKVTAQQMIAQGIIRQELVAKLNPYMVPFVNLPVWRQTTYRLQLQLARTLLRHNRNVERAHKRQR